MRRSGLLLAVIALATAACGGSTAEPGNAQIASEAALTEFWPCGIGFAASNAEQTVALLVYSSDNEPTPPVSFPDAGWDARLVVGKDLMANHCDDVIEEGEPVPEIEEEWHISTGSLEYTDPGTGFCGAAGPVTGTFTDLEAENSQTVVKLGDLTVLNENYGCFAG